MRQFHCGLRGKQPDRAAKRSVHAGGKMYLADRRDYESEENKFGQAKTKKLFYFVANVVVFRQSDKRCLILKRDEREKVHSGEYAVPREN